LLWAANTPAQTPSNSDVTRSYGKTNAAPQSQQLAVSALAEILAEQGNHVKRPVLAAQSSPEAAAQSMSILCIFRLSSENNQ
jgi:hypothetical protein